MPILQGPKRIDPLDINKNVKIGVAFPLDETNLFQGTSTFKEQAKTNIINVLLTEPGERINLPDYGLGLKGMLFQNDIDLEALKNNAQTQISRWVPNIVLIDVKTKISTDKHSFSLNITYIYSLDGSSDSIELNFN